MGIKLEYNFKLIEEKNNILTFKLDSPYFEAQLAILEEDIFKVTMLNNGKINMNKTWTVAPGLEDIPTEGRNRFDYTLYSLPKYNLKKEGNFVTLSTSKLTAKIDLNGFKITWFGFKDGEWIKIASDRKTQAYNFNYWGDEIYHYLERELEEQYFGFGERTGKVNKHFRRMRMVNVDPMGYDAEWTDAMYKHTPFYITRNSKTEYNFGIFYDNFSTVTMEMGTELDNYHGLYRYFNAKSGDLDYYVIAGPHIKDVTERFSWLTGKTIFTPKWSIGYSGSTMTYTDLPDAQKQMNNFLNDCKKHNIPCDSFQLSSGYTSIGDKRYVFNWNTDKFPDAKGFSSHYHDNGINLCANIKPCFLHDHPLFKELDDKGYFIKERDSNNTELVQFWDDNGAYLDFTNIEAFKWWKSKVKTQLLDYGIDSTWNDNNEFEIWDGKAKCNGFNTSTDIEMLKPIQTLLMMKASYEAQKEYAPEKRPYLISRAGCPGMQRYVQTWSGDNRTDWKTIKFNNYMAISLSLSGVYNIGHDVGGFSGAAPSPELFVRWIQNGIFYPRFTIHSWNDDKTVNVPWMYPEVIKHVSKAMSFRRMITPYIYNLIHKSSTEYSPIIKPTFYNYESDLNTFKENEEFLLGDSMLVASIMEEGAESKNIYLPEGNSWYYYNTNEIYNGGQIVTVQACLNDFPLLIKEGAIIPINNTEYTFETKNNDYRAFLVYAHTNIGEASYTLFEDDGLTEKYKSGECANIKVTLQTTKNDIIVTITAKGDKRFIQKDYPIKLIDSKNRNLIVKYSDL